MKRSARSPTRLLHLPHAAQPRSLHLPHAAQPRSLHLPRFVAMETGGARLLVAPLDSVALLSVDSVALPSEEVAAAAICWPESDEVTMENVSNPLLSAALLAADYMTSDLQEIAADSVALDSQEPDEGKTPESMEVVPDSLPPEAFVCGRCGLVHEDREAWNRAHSRFYPCPSCGLIHADIKFAAMFGRIKVDCKRFMEHYPGWLPTKDTKASVRYNKFKI